MKTGLTDERLAALLAEHERLGERISEIDGRLGADEEALEEVARGTCGGPGRPATLSEVAERNALLDLAGTLSAEDVRVAWEGRDLALDRRRRIIREIADGLPEDEWVACGEWALRVSREYRTGPRLLQRALAVAVGRQAEGADHRQVLSLSAALERSVHPRISQARRLLCSRPWVRKALKGVCAGALIASLVVCLVAYAGFAAEDSSVLDGLACFAAMLFSMGCMIALLGLEEATSVYRDPLPPEEPGTVRPGRLTAAYKLPEDEPDQTRVRDARARGLQGA